MKTIYKSLSDLTDPQISVMNFIEWWVHNRKTPTPYKEIIKKTTKDGMNKKTIIYSIKILCKYGYIRRDLSGGGNSKAAFVQLRRI